jgi:hypothetical protein
VVAVELVVLRQGFAKHYGRRRRREEGRTAPGEGVRQPSHPLSIYRVKGRGGRHP